MLTILTPTYNRGYILPKLLKSLENQRDLDFQWIIIDDGSTDETNTLVSSWIMEHRKFLIKYLRKENGGKHTALNYAMPYVDTPFVMIVDSDDELTSTAVSKIKCWLKLVEEDMSFAGVSGLRGVSEFKKIGEFPKKICEGGYIDALNTERRKKHLRGDKAEVYRTKLLQEYAFPEIKGEKFLTESVVWNELAYNGYKVRWYNDIIQITNYLDDGLTQNLQKNRFKNFEGYTLEIKSEMRCDDYYKYRCLGRYLIMAHKKGLKKEEVCNKLGIRKMDFFIGRMISFLQNFRDCFRKYFSDENG